MLQASHFDVKTHLQGNPPDPNAACTTGISFGHGRNLIDRRIDKIKKIYRTCIRMSQKEYAMLRKKSKADGMTMNKYLMQELEKKRPWMNREPESMELAEHLNRVGKAINVIARDFNSGFGTAEQLNQAVSLLKEVYAHACEVREKGYLHAS